MFEKGTFVKLNLSEGHIFNGYLGCVLGSSGRKRHPLNVALLPREGDPANIQVTVAETALVRITAEAGFDSLPKPVDRKCREGHVFWTAEDQVGQCWCGASVEINLVDSQLNQQGEDE